MPRFTPDELQAAKKRKADEQTAEQERYTEQRALLAEAKARHSQLESVVDGLYGEIGKQASKWPTAKVSQLSVERTNKAIEAVKELMKDEDDEFVEGLSTFIPAGDLPENRDVALTLREMQEALRRFKKKYIFRWTGL